MKIAIVEGVKAFANQLRSNYKEHIEKEFYRLNSKNKLTKSSK